VPSEVRRVSPAERDALRRALELADEDPAAAHPNPTVGAAVLDPTGRLVGLGRSAPPGGPHAEIAALGAAGSGAEGGTLAVTLEPCHGTGRTGPCTTAILAAGIRRVVYCAADPAPGFAGGGAALAAAGVDVVGGVERAAARASAGLAGWLSAAEAGRPVVTWKVAASLDGRTAAADGSSRWITGPAARRAAHQLRARHDAVLVGSGTVLADDPELTVRDAGDCDVRQPLRVIADPRGRTPATARALGPGALVAVSTGVRWRGPAEVVEVARQPAALLAVLGRRGVRSVLLEGGPTLAAAFLTAGLVDRAVVHVGPVLLGAGPPALAGLDIGTIAAAQRWQIDGVGRLGPDAYLTARPLREA
jgi:diaminohydroxyphosphoribosylaminopyrimidine deaminase/5-amino-6-(5-phosphoribosylamino)uracil reductase